MQEYGINKLTNVLQINNKIVYQLLTIFNKVNKK